MSGARLSVREIQIINTLFSSDIPMTSLDIVMKNPGLSQSTIQAILRKLLNNGLVEVVNKVHSGNVLARAFRGTEKAKEEVLMYMVDEYQKISGVLSISELAEAMMGEETDIQKRIIFLKEVISKASQMRTD